MNEDIFKTLEFNKIDVSVEESGFNQDYYYYELTIGDICFITCANDEAVDGNWWCSIFDSMTLSLTQEADLTNIVEIIKRNTKNEQV